MPIGLIGKKLGMSQIFDENGMSVPVTLIQAGPCVVTQIKDPDRDHYSAVQVGFGEVKESKVNKPEAGHFKKADVTPMRMLREFRIEADELENYEVGQTLSCSLFERNDIVDVIGTTKGRGFSGVMKRHGFHGSPKTHGTHEAFRHGGSIGGMYPQRVVKGRKMPGQYGNTRQTTQNLTIINISEEQNILMIKGAVPGAKNGYLLIQKAVKRPVKSK